MTTTRTLTVADLEAALRDERHLGWGYATADNIENVQTRSRLDAAVVAVANELGLDAEQLFHWSNSKHGRWLIDRVHGCDEAPTQATVRKQLNPTAVAEAMHLS